MLTSSGSPWSAGEDATLADAMIFNAGPFDKSFDLPGLGGTLATSVTGAQEYVDGIVDYMRARSHARTPSDVLERLVALRQTHGPDAASFRRFSSDARRAASTPEVGVTPSSHMPNGLGAGGGVTTPVGTLQKKRKHSAVAVADAASASPRRSRSSYMQAGDDAIPLALADERPRRALRLPRKRLFALAFAWPEGAAWDDSGKEGRKHPPRWYADCITELILHYASDGVSSFVVHVHGALSSTVLRALEVRWQAAFDAARTAAGACGREGTESLSLFVCPESAHPMYPVAARASTLLDSTSERVVLCVDVHDSLERQAKEIEALLEQVADDGTSAGFTAWPGHGLRASFSRNDPTLSPPPLCAVETKRCVSLKSTPSALEGHAPRESTRTRWPQPPVRHTERNVYTLPHLAQEGRGPRLAPGLRIAPHDAQVPPCPRRLAPPLVRAPLA